ncbi:Ferredoxin reductase [Marinobacterium lacunae]|uniref:Ferredoxin reductase n=1 Tax=Marinobacterium lacunae TaxID=1232683 RepID=A0A081FTV6_9GAMM|nr:FAD-dependent oxidoreductase [Marinobacterium lacunae]KEA61961.1 Ferredoxin reductase [Marinobacterium lacunae]
MTDAGIVIVGGGHAGLSIAEALRRKGYEGRLQLLNAEAGLPYQRPPLSKQFLKGEWDEARLVQRNAGFYTKQRIERLSSAKVISIDPAQHTLSLENGAQLHWQKLALAMGSRLRRLAVPGSDARGVYYLHSLHHALALREAMTKARRIVVIGGGFIGLEAACAFASAGKQVTLLDRADTLLSRSASTPVASYLQQLHSGKGVQIENRARVTEIAVSNAEVSGVRLDDGQFFAADIVLVGIGVEPEVALAEMAGLACSDGVQVDAYCLTSHPDIVAAGDIARFHHPLYNRSVRLESIQNAVEQGKHAAGTLLGMRDEYRAVPWFWSDQYDTKLQIAGLSADHDLEVIRGDEHSGRFSVFCYAQKQLVAVETLNAPADHMIARRLIQAGVSPKPDDAANPDFDLRSLL